MLFSLYTREPEREDGEYFTQIHRSFSRRTFVNERSYFLYFKCVLTLTSGFSRTCMFLFQVCNLMMVRIERKRKEHLYVL